mgnify:CR=1 FL=1
MRLPSQRLMIIYYPYPFSMISAAQTCACAVIIIFSMPVWISVVMYVIVVNNNVLPFSCIHRGSGNRRAVMDLTMSDGDMVFSYIAEYC